MIPVDRTVNVLPANVGSPVIVGSVDNVTAFDFQDVQNIWGVQGFQDFGTFNEILPQSYIVIPEPSTGLLLALGLLPIGLMRRSL